MSLHDIDKNNGGRIVPTPNSNDDVMQRMAQGTGQVQNSGEEEIDGLRFQERQILAVQDGVNKAAFGFYGAANKFGLKVAEDGTDVLEAEDDQLLFNSEQNVFKIVASGTATDTTPNPWASGGAIVKRTTTIPHNLGYTPICIVFADNPTIAAFYGADGITNLPSTFYVMGASAIPILYNSARVDSTNLYIDLFNFGTSLSPSYTWTWRWYLLQETAN